MTDLLPVYSMSRSSFHAESFQQKPGATRADGTQPGLAESRKRGSYCLIKNSFCATEPRAGSYGSTRTQLSRTLNISQQVNRSASALIGGTATSLSWARILGILKERGKKKKKPVKAVWAPITRNVGRG